MINNNVTISQRITLAMITALSIVSSTAFADPPHRHWHGHKHRFHHYDYPRWHDGPWYQGHWYHGDHRGRFGWWWVTAGAWYFYPAPIYPYPDPYAPPTVMIDPEPAPQREPIWYYCESSRTYYPYVSVCPEGWRAVPAQPRDSSDRDIYERDDDELKEE